MEKETAYLISLLSAHLSGEKIALDDSINFKKLYNRARAHNLCAMLFSAINGAENKITVPSEVYERLQTDFFGAVMRYDNQKLLIYEIKSILENGGVYHIFFKGAEIKEYFPVPQSRIMGDIDVLIKESDRDKVKSLLTNNGYDVVNENGPVYDYEKNGLKIEVHTKIISGKVGSSNAEEYFSDAIEHGVSADGINRLDENYHFAYLIAHLAHHFWFYGAGIKLVADLSVMQKQFEIDFDKVFEILKDISLDEFAKTVLTVCYKWFGTGRDFSKDTEKTEEFLSSYGVFGNLNRNNSAVIERKQLEEGKNVSPVMTKLRLMFPSYQKMKNIPYISFIEGKPYLTPAAWAYRFYYNLRYRKEFVKGSTENIGSDESKKQAEEELAYFKEVGLL